MQDCANFMADHLPQQVAVYFKQYPEVSVIATSVFVLVIVLALLRSTSNHENLSARTNLVGANRNIKDVGAKSSNYSDLFSSKDDSERRKQEYADLVNQYYDLSTDFYEFGWGESFHFAPRYKGEDLQESIRRHEYWLASRLGLKEGMKVLDCGCGVGGPARNIARFSRAQVTGVSLNEYQINRGNAKNVREGLDKLVHLQQANFMNLPFNNDHFDRVYAIEATCHAPDRVKCYSELYRVLKPGGYFAAYEWVRTDNYDPTNEDHRRIKFGIEVGDGLPDLTGADDCHTALEKAGFQIQDFRDLAADPDFSPVPWYQPFIGGFKTNPIAIRVTNAMVWLLELLRLAPKGTHVMHTHLCEAAVTLRAGGEQQLFTPMLYFLAYKPKEDEQTLDDSIRTKKAETTKAEAYDSDSGASIASSVMKRRRRATPKRSRSKSSKRTVSRSASKSVTRRRSRAA